MSDLPQGDKPRKILKPRILKLPPEVRRDHIERSQAKFMVWREGGPAPVKIYDDPKLACEHAEILSRVNNHPFHVFRTWRIIKGVK